MTVKERLNEIENRYEHQKETAEYAGISMILGDYEFLMQQAKRAQERDCIHCNGKGFNGLDYCSQCNHGEGNEDE